MMNLVQVLTAVVKQEPIQMRHKNSNVFKCVDIESYREITISRLEGLMAEWVFRKTPKDLIDLQRSIDLMQKEIAVLNTIK